MVRKIKKGKKKKPTAPQRAVRVVTNIHVNSKSGTRSARQRRGGVGGSVAPSGVSTISHVPLVMNVPAPDATQRETKWMHALEDIQGDNIALRMQLDEFMKNQGTGNPLDPNDKNPFQKQPSKANFEEPLVEAPARPARGRPRKDTQRAEPMNEPRTLRASSVPPASSVPSVLPRMPHSEQKVGLKGSHIPGLGTLEEPLTIRRRKKKQQAEEPTKE